MVLTILVLILMVVAGELLQEKFKDSKYVEMYFLGDLMYHLGSAWLLLIVGLLLIAYIGG